MRQAHLGPWRLFETLAFIRNQCLQYSYRAVKPLVFKQGPAFIQIQHLFEELRYTAEERTVSGKYTAENGPTKACRHLNFLELLKVRFLRLELSRIVGNNNDTPIDNDAATLNGNFQG